ncbi:MAG TPA: chemotaxis protein CheC, partial [Negativicutes bacterium]
MMSDGFLSQDEIEALLRGEPSTAPAVADLSDMEKDALGEIGNISMGSAATNLS